MFQRLSLESDTEICGRIRSASRDIFSGLSDSALVSLLDTLAPVSVTTSKTDILGIAFGEYIGSTAKSKNGQFFTPREIVDFIMALVRPRAYETVIDPACGSGGFLIAASEYTRPENLHGVELNSALARIAQLNMEMHGGSSENILNANSLFDQIDEQYDIVLANPPYGLTVSDKDGAYTLSKKGKVKSEVAFLERIYHLLKPGGRAALLIPDGMLGNTSDKYVRTWMSETFHMVGVISFPQHTFTHTGTHTKTSVLLLRKPFDGERLGYYLIFMAIANEVGYNANGKDISEHAIHVDEDGQNVPVIRCGDLMSYNRDRRDNLPIPTNNSILGNWERKGGTDRWIPPCFTNQPSAATPQH